LKPPETALLERMKSRGGEITDRFLINFVEHQISRIEVCFTVFVWFERSVFANLGNSLVPAPLLFATVYGHSAVHRCSSRRVIWAISSRSSMRS